LIASRTKARWFCIHAIANLFVVLFGLSDVLHSFADPYNSGKGDYNLVPFYFIVAVHAYHLLAFSDLKADDYFHHCTFGVIICTFGFLDSWGPVQNVVGMFLSGLPGGLIYCNLVLKAHKLMDATTEKKWAARINTWIRAPGALFGAFMLYSIARDAANRSDFVNWYSRYMAFGVALLSAFNALYYGNQVTVSTARKDEKFVS